MKDTYKEILNDIEQAKVIAFCEDKLMFNAVKKYILQHLYQGISKPGEVANPTVNYALQLDFGRQGEVYNNAGGIVAFTPRTNEELGRDLRALARGIHIIEGGFQELSQLKKPEEVKEEEPNHI